MAFGVQFLSRAHPITPPDVSEVIGVTAIRRQGNLNTRA
jgi:hypothetical protein